jgi:hypothetical protein
VRSTTREPESCLAPRPRGQIVACHEAEFVDRIGERPDLDYEFTDDAEMAADDVLSVLSALVGGIDEDLTDECYSPAQHAMNTVEAFVYRYELSHLKVSADNDLVVDQHELVQNAMPAERRPCRGRADRRRASGGRRAAGAGDGPEHPDGPVVSTAMSRPVLLSEPAEYGTSAELAVC